MKPETSNTTTTKEEFYLKKKQQSLDYRDLKEDGLYIAKGYFDEIKDILGRDPDWIRAETIAYIYPEDLSKMFERIENPNARFGHTKLQWWFGVEYLDRVFVAGDWHLKIRRLFAKKQDFDGTCSYVQKPMKEIDEKKIAAGYCGGAEDWPKYKDRAIYV
ncbi:MAG: hypothetical protein K8S87_04060 [Planctomycetes bacterium]|nr:hypothetical protein [Planctomycetota bacterium]